MSAPTPKTDSSDSRTHAAQRSFEQRLGPHLQLVIRRANNIARRFDHEFLGCEHILLALMSDEALTAYAVVSSFTDPKIIVEQLNSMIVRGVPIVTIGRLPVTPRLKKALESAEACALSLGEQCLNSEHMLIGLLRVDENIAAHVLTGHGITEDIALAKIEEIRVRRAAPPSVELTGASTDKDFGEMLQLQLRTLEQVLLNLKAQVEAVEKSIAKMAETLCVENEKANATDPEKKSFRKCFDGMKKLGPTGWDNVPNIKEALDELR